MVERAMDGPLGAVVGILIGVGIYAVVLFLLLRFANPRDRRP